MTDEEKYMTEALSLAYEAEIAGDIPVGAVVVRHGKIVGRGRNRRESGGGATAHAEIEAITDACRTLGGWRLCGCEMYVTLEPCPMCAGAIVNARLDRVVFGASDPRGGALGGLFDLREYPLGCKTLVKGGILKKECSDLLGAFFEAKRSSKRENEAKHLRLGRAFFSEHADRVAPELLGKILCRKNHETGDVMRVMITETECYLGENDTACHASKGKTDRTRILWDKGGTVYVYLCYGMHNMLNIVTGSKGEPEAVLIRGTEDIGEYGEDPKSVRHEGPGRVTKHLGIDRSLNGGDVVLSDEIWIETDGTPTPDFETTPRIGIDYASEEDRSRPWRYVMKKD